MTISRRIFLEQGLAAAALAAAAGPRAAAAMPGDVLTPEMFGAKGDGATNDTAAFAALSARIMAKGGGTVTLRKTTYIVGRQVPSLRPGTPYGYMPSPILQIGHCARPIVIQGNGAVLRAAPGLRFGTFDVTTGAPVKHPMPYTQTHDRATPYEYMIHVEDCGDVTISDLELDGNLARLKIGGPYGDTGWQIAGSGIYLRNNRGSEILRNIHSHHHPQDGLMIDGLDDAALAGRVTRTVQNFRSEYNGRQGCSLVGGRGYAFTACRFNHTGKGGLYSAPGAGLDIEAEDGKRNVDLSFTDCEFSDNTGAGMVADSGPSEGASFTRCTFIGTTSWSLWPKKPRFVFRSCTIVGSMCQAATVTDRRLATTFIDCNFFDDPAKSPNRKVFVASGTFGAIADLNEEGNPIFQGCRFILTHNAQLPWSIKATYRDCVMSQKSPRQGYPRGTYEGKNVITGNVDLYGSPIPGEVTLNGRRYARDHF